MHIVVQDLMFIKEVRKMDMQFLTIKVRRAFLSNRTAFDIYNKTKRTLYTFTLAQIFVERQHLNDLSVVVTHINSLNVKRKHRFADNPFTTLHGMHIILKSLDIFCSKLITLFSCFFLLLLSFIL